MWYVFQGNSKYNHRISLNKVITPRSRQTSTTSTVSNTSIKSRLSMNEPLNSIMRDDKDSKDNEGTNNKRTSHSKLSFSDSVDTISEAAIEPDDCEVQDTFDEDTASTIKRHRRFRRSRLRWVHFIQVIRIWARRNCFNDCRTCVLDRRCWKRRSCYWRFPWTCKRPWKYLNNDFRSFSDHQIQLRTSWI